MIHVSNVNEVFLKRNIILWLISAFKAGFINSAGFLATGKFVSHVTGFGTMVGVAIGHDGYLFGAELLIIPGAYIFGAIVTSFFLDKDYKENETPPYYLIQGLITVMVGLVLFLELSGWVDTNAAFDVDELFDPVEFTIIALLCFICGLKNGLVTWTSFGKIRVTHLTGLSTDIGLHFIRMFIKQPSPRFKEERMVNVIRILTFFAFSIGAFLSAYLFPKFSYKVFILVLLISFGITCISIWDSRLRAKNVKPILTR